MYVCLNESNMYVCLKHCRGNGNIITERYYTKFPKNNNNEILIGERRMDEEDEEDRAARGKCFHLIVWGKGGCGVKRWPDNRIIGNYFTK